MPRFVDGHVKVYCQLTVSIPSPWNASIEDIHDGTLHECFKHVLITVDNPGSMLANNPIGIGMNDRVGLILWV